MERLLTSLMQVVFGFALLAVSLASTAATAGFTPSPRNLVGGILWLEWLTCVQDTYASGETLKTAVTSCSAEFLAPVGASRTGETTPSERRKR